MNKTGLPRYVTRAINSDWVHESPYNKLSSDEWEKAAVRIIGDETSQKYESYSGHQVCFSLLPHEALRAYGTKPEDVLQGIVDLVVSNYRGIGDDFSNFSVFEIIDEQLKSVDAAYYVHPPERRKRGRFPFGCPA